MSMTIDELMKELKWKWRKVNKGHIQPKILYAEEDVRMALEKVAEQARQETAREIARFGCVHSLDLTVPQSCIDKGLAHEDRCWFCHKIEKYLLEKEAGR